MPVSHVLIIGAGPAGLAAAIAISQLSAPTPPIRVTVLELRPAVAATATALGGAVNLTPLALRYLDRLGAGTALRPRGAAVSGIDLLSPRTGKLLGTLWRGEDALRVRRNDLVDTLLTAARKAPSVTIRHGARVADVLEEGDGSAVVVMLEGGEELRGDMLIACDGLHSVARKKYVEPGRGESYSGRAVANGYVTLQKPGDAGLERADGQAGLVDTTLISGRYGSLMMSFCDPVREELYMAVVLGLGSEIDGNAEGARDGWKARGADKAKLKEEISKRFQGGKILGMTRLVDSVDDWTLYPVYQLSPGGRWSRGRVLLLGDAAHAMPPQGESTGIAMEDGVLLAHVLSRHSERTVPQLVADYEKLRRPAIDRLYKETVWRWQSAIKEDSGWFWSVFMDWLTVVFLLFMNLRKKDYFGKDVARLELPA